MKRVLFLVTLTVFFATSAMATTVNPLGGGDGSEANMQTILDNITYGGNSSVDAFNDFIADTGDSYWTTGGTGISSATMIIEIAGLQNSNVFGIYDSADVSNKATLFSGLASAGSKVAMTFGTYNGGADNLAVINLDTLTGSYYNFNSQTFGFYLNDFYSDSSLNSDKADHMVAYASQGDLVKLPGAINYTNWLPNEFILGFEDLAGGDFDYNDMVLMIESVSPVPEPGTLLLLGSGLIGLAFLKRRKQA